MADIVDKKTRSRMMSTIRGSDTKPEVQLRRALHKAGFRFRKNDRKLPGKPDIVLPRWKAVIMVHGCFWHRHQGCRFSTSPASRAGFWSAKFAVTVERDVQNLAKLTALGWRHAIVWECALKKMGPEQVGAFVAQWLRSDSSSCILSADQFPLP